VNQVDGKELSVELQIRVITWVWGQQPPSDGWVWMGWMDRGTDGTKVAWRDRWFARQGRELTEDTIAEISSFLHTRGDKDIYFSPVIYARRGHRTKANTTPSRIVHADYDAVDPRGFSPALIPQLVWETSPGSWQGLHVLQEPLALEEWERLSRRLTRGLGADRGCWDMPHPIRVPGRRNYKPTRVRKYGPQGAPGRFLRWKRDEAVDPSERSEWLALPEPEELEAFDPAVLLPVTSGEAGQSTRDMLEAARSRLTATARAMLRDDEGRTGDRSEHVHATAKELLKAGLSADQAAAMLVADSVAFHEKFGGRRDIAGQVRREIEAALRSLSREGWRRTETTTGEVNLQEPAADIEELASLTDTGNAVRLVEKWGREIRWVAEWMTWIVWDPDTGVWVRDDRNAVRGKAIELAKDLMRSGVDITDGRSRLATLKWASASLSASAGNNCLTQAKALPGVVVLAPELDADGYLLGVGGGMVLDLRTGEARKAEPEDLITKRTTIPWSEGGAKPSWWLKFLTETIGAENLDLMQRLVGSTLVGVAKKWFITLQGPTDSGKSQLQRVLHGLMGDYSGTVKRDTFAYTKFERNNQDGLAALTGARFAMWSETKDGLRVDEALLKDLTDGTGLPKKVSRKYEKAYDMTPQMTLWMDTNHAPNLRHGDDALWNRVIVLHTNGVVPVHAQIPRLGERILEAEGPAILRWAAEGAKAWLADGGDKGALKIPKGVDDQVQEYRSERDELGRWLEEVLEPFPPRVGEEVVVRGELLGAWNEEVGGKMTPQAFNRELGRRGIVQGLAKDDPWVPVNLQGVVGKKRMIPGFRWSGRRAG